MGEAVEPWPSATSTLAVSKRCPACVEVKPASEFQVTRRLDRGGRERLASYCTPCMRAYQKRRLKGDPTLQEQNRRQTWRYRLKTQYGMTEAQWYDLLESQGYGCAICGTKEARRRLSVDHCHLTGKVRGILCDACNHALGCMTDDPERLIAAAEYLRRSTRECLS